MKFFKFILLLSVLSLIGCKKDSVDASSTQAMQSSINDMASSLNTLQQVKFNEALYILKTFGVEGSNDMQRLKNLGKLINAKKVSDILSMADATAQKNGIEWTSIGPPSLGEMNIFGNENASEFDPNDIKASAVTITTKNVAIDSVLGAKAIQVIPRLIDSRGKLLDFSGAALQTKMQVSSNGSNILTSNNLMKDNNFKGFYLKLSSLPYSKVIDGVIDISLIVKTSKKTLKITKIGIPINIRALSAPSKSSDTDTNLNESGAKEIVDDEVSPNEKSTENTKSIGDPKNTVVSFLNNLSNQNYKGAFSKADNPDWGSYDNFANPTSGFGGVKSINIKSISSQDSNDNSASVRVVYEVTQKNGTTSVVNSKFGLKNVNGEWKITNYRLN